MKIAKGNLAERKDIIDKTTSGVGIFCGQPEITGNMGCFIITVICGISTIVFAFSSFGADPLVRENMILTIIYILITVFAVFFTVFTFVYPLKTRKNFVFEGIWFSGDKIWLGEQEIELKENRSFNGLMKDRTKNIHASWNQTKRVSCINVAETSMILKVVASKHDYMDYRIEKIQINNKRDGAHYDFIAAPTVLMIDGILYPCATLTLIEQLKKIAKGTTIIRKRGGICNLSIIPQDGPFDNLFAKMKKSYESNGLVIDKMKIQHAISTLQKGEFIDKENSDFLIKLIKNYGWKIEF